MMNPCKKYLFLGRLSRRVTSRSVACPEERDFVPGFSGDIYYSINNRARVSSLKVGGVAVWFARACGRSCLHI